jgi:hypothetical protein
MRVLGTLPSLALLAPFGLTLLVAGPATAAERTALSITNGPLEAAYSQGIALRATLTREDGRPLSPDEHPCLPGGLDDAGPPCRVTWTVAPSDGGGGEAPIVIADPVVGADGTIVARLTIVDGRPAGSDSVFVTAPDGAAWTVSAQFLGAGAGASGALPDCEPDGPQDVDGDLCPSSGSTPLTLFPEDLTIVLQPGIAGDLGDTVTLAAEVSDPNGDAEEGGTDLDGGEKKVIAGTPVSFFYDADNDGNASADERIATTTTDDDGVARADFVLDPLFVRAGTYDAGIHAERSGDARYATARASQRIVVGPGAIDVGSTVLEIDPPEIPADGNSTAVLRVRLVDRFGNLLDATSEAHDVAFEATLGVLDGDVRRDAATGVYTQTVRAQRRPGTAEIRVTVDGEAAATGELTLTGAAGCACGSSAAGTPARAVAVGLVVIAVHVVRRRGRAAGAS